MEHSSYCSHIIAVHPVIYSGNTSLIDPASLYGHRYINGPSVLGGGQGESIAWHAWLIATQSHALDGNHPFHRYREDLRKLSWAFWDIQRLKQLGAITEESTESNIVLNFDMQVQKTYQEQRGLDPKLHALDQEVDARKWEKEFRTRFYTTPSCYKNIKGYYPQLKPILQFAEESAIEK